MGSIGTDTRTCTVNDRARADIWDRYVQLTQNFRSHLRILDFPNGRFYNNSLRPFGDRKVIESYIGHPILPNPKFPIIFHALSGEDAREASSPSFFNPLQVIQVKKYIEQLRADRRVRIGTVIFLCARPLTDPCP